MRSRESGSTRRSPCCPWLRGTRGGIGRLDVETLSNIHSMDIAINGKTRTLSHHPYWRPFNLFSYFSVSCYVRSEGHGYVFTDPMLP
jgi:hypothetical protein